MGFKSRIKRRVTRGFIPSFARFHTQIASINGIIHASLSFGKRILEGILVYFETCSHCTFVYTLDHVPDFFGSREKKFGETPVAKPVRSEIKYQFMDWLAGFLASTVSFVFWNYRPLGKKKNFATILEPIFGFISLPFPHTIIELDSKTTRVFH